MPRNIFSGNSIELKFEIAHLEKNMEIVCFAKKKQDVYSVYNLIQEISRFEGFYIHEKSITGNIVGMFWKKKWPISNTFYGLEIVLLDKKTIVDL